MREYKINKIYIDEKVKDYPLTRKIIKNSVGVEKEFIPDLGKYRKKFKELPTDEGKRVIFVTRYKGNFLKSCPGTGKGYLCCRYKIINQAINCPLDCTYCILQVYLNNPLTIYVNTEGIFQEIDKKLASEPDRLFRMGTGELTDSLALDYLTDFSSQLIDYFSHKENVIFEFKTKTDEIKPLLEKPRAKNIVVSWSLNPQKIIEKEELRTASLKRRLMAARQAQEKGFKLGFHFDPILYFKNWEREYQNLVNQLFSYVDSRNIVWISLGSFRYPPSLKEVIKERFPESRIIYQEQIRGLDKKMRYIKPLRISMYKKIYDWLKQKDEELFCYFCMESPDVWDKVMGYHPQSNAHLDYLFAQSIYKRFKDLGFKKPKRSYY